MVEKLIDRLIEKQRSEDMISQEDINVYRYGYTLVFEVIINILIAIVIGIVFQDLPVIALFLLFYIPLRSFCGGWHAGKLWQCTVLSNLLLVILALADEYGAEKLPLVWLSLIFCVGLALVFALAPVDTKSKPISPEERRVYRRRIRVILVLHVILMAVAILLRLRELVFLFAFVYVTQTMMLMLELINKQMIKRRG